MLDSLVIIISTATRIHATHFVLPHHGLADGHWASVRREKCWHEMPGNNTIALGCGMQEARTVIITILLLLIETKFPYLSRPKITVTVRTYAFPVHAYIFEPSFLLSIIMTAMMKMIIMLSVTEDVCKNVIVMTA